MGVVKPYRGALSLAGRVVLSPLPRDRLLPGLCGRRPLTKWQDAPTRT
jgi:hypothetical protein